MRFEELELLSHNDLFDRFDDIVTVVTKKNDHIRHHTEDICPKDRAKKSLVSDFFECDASRQALFKWPSIDLNLSSGLSLNRQYGAKVSRDRREGHKQDKGGSETSIHLKLSGNAAAFRITHSKGQSTKRSSRGLTLGSSIDFKNLRVPGMNKRLPAPSIKTKKIY